LSQKESLVAADDADNVLQGYLGPTPPVGQLPARGERFWIERPEQLLNAVNVLKKAHVVAVDAEFTQIRARAQTPEKAISTVPRLSLLQLAIDRTCFVVDTLRLHNLAPLAEVLSNPQIAVLLHGAGGDIRVMAERGLQVVRYYDLEATCRSIFGQRESSLAAMLQRAFAFSLDKTLQRTDWTRRPLPPAMIAYAARDAEVTLALYHWLDRHYHTILQAHQVSEQMQEVMSVWIEPFLRGGAPISPEIAVAEAKKCGLIQNRSQVLVDCRTALSQVIHPMRRSRLLRLIADLGLTAMVPDILPLLAASTADERAGSARALGRLGVSSAVEAITPLLQDPVQDVRKAAQTAIHNLTERETLKQRAVPVRNVDGSRRWVIDHEQNGSAPVDNDDSWQSRLRSIMDV
jgi:hypothetical protein